jgi:hypothetical protein
MSDSKPVTYSALAFDKGMTPKVFTPDSATRIEHFDTITEVLKPFHAIGAGRYNGGSWTDIQAIQPMKFTYLNDIVYMLGRDNSTTAYGAVYYYDASQDYWTGKISTNANATCLPSFIAHAGFFFGVKTSGGNDYIWKLTTGGTYSATFYDTLSAIGSSKGVADPIVHSKDGIAYFPIGNIIHKIPSNGTSAGSIGLTLPNSNFRITSICEQGNYINIVGFDSTSQKSSSLLWDRDTSVVDLTESYDLGPDVVLHNGNLLGTTFFIQLRQDSITTRWTETPTLVIKWLNGPTPTTLYEFPVASCRMDSYSIGAKYVATDRIYFTAVVKMIGESTARNVVFCLDQKGRLTIAQNIELNTDVTSLARGIIRTGEGFQYAGGNGTGAGVWGSIDSYTTISSYETSDIRAKDLSKNLDFHSGTITCEPLPASAQILVKMRKNEETTWTTVETLTETNRAKFSLTPAKIKNALSGLDKARQVRIRLESTVGAVITGFQAVFNEVTDSTF